MESINQNKLHSHCGVTTTLKLIGGKWTMNLLHHLQTGPTRFGQLQRALPGISSKTLTARLQELEAAGIITRTVFQEIPLHVEYALTPKGRELETVFAAMDRWGQQLPRSVNHTTELSLR